MKKKLDLNISKINTNFPPKFSEDKEDDSLILFEKTLTETFKSKSRKHSLKLINNNNNNIKKSLTKKNFNTLKTLNKTNKKTNNNNKIFSSNKKPKNNNNNLILLQKEINFKPINDFLQNDNIFQITDAQTDIMHELDEIYQNKIKKIKDLKKLISGNKIEQ